MENVEKETGELISEEEFRKKLSSYQRYNPEAVSTFRSTGRAARRGHLMKSGMIVPNRPYHNRRNTCRRKGHSSRLDNDLKKEMWLEVKAAAAEVIRQHTENKDEQ